jgi:hypothetical protein
MKKKYFPVYKSVDDIELDDASQKVLDHLKLKSRDLQRIMAVYEDIDIDNSGAVEYREFAKFCGERRNFFSDSMFRLIDVDHNGELSFNVRLLLHSVPPAQRLRHGICRKIPNTRTLTTYLDVWSLVPHAPAPYAPEVRDPTSTRSRVVLGPMAPSAVRGSKIPHHSNSNADSQTRSRSSHTLTYNSRPPPPLSHRRSPWTPPFLGVFPGHLAVLPVVTGSDPEVRVRHL